jgi:predicted enzyme related to lactoylglutathione lyase
MVESAAATLDAVVTHGGQVVQPIGTAAPAVSARLRDPAGNVMGLYLDPICSTSSQK